MEPEQAEFERAGITGTGRREHHGAGANLQLTSFVGRRRELDDLRQAFKDTRLLTLTGVGGVGKTRLARRFVEQVRRNFPDGTWFVDLTSVRLHDVADLHVVAEVTASTLGLRLHTGQPTTDQLVDHSTDQLVLITLDNCEHVLDASVTLAEALLRHCPNVRLLATSREPLRIPGERLYAVPPLTNGKVAGASDAVEMFAARARAVQPEFEVTSRNVADVAAICEHLDGLPLAIELAASWLRVLTPAQLLGRLHDRFDLLQSRGRGLPDRQQNLRSCIAWSYNFCTSEERTLWARMSVFVDGCELDAIEGVCADDELPEADVLDTVAGLVDKSVLVRETAGSAEAHARYHMLESIREFALEQLEGSEAESRLRRRHRDWYARLVHDARSGLIGEQQIYWLERLGQEHPNLRAAVQYSLATPGEAQSALHLAAGLPDFYWSATGRFAEGRRWLDAAIAATPESPLQARALILDSYLAFAQGDIAAGSGLLARGADLAERLGSGPEIAYAALIAGMGALFANAPATAIDVLTPARTMLAEHPEHDEFDLHLHVLMGLAFAAAVTGDRELGHACGEEMLDITAHLDGGYHRSNALWAGGVVKWRAGELPDAEAQLAAATKMKLPFATYDPWGVAVCVETLSWATADLGRAERAATLLGIADALWTELGSPIESYAQLISFHDECMRQTQRALGMDRFARVLARGRAMPRTEFLDFILERSPAASAVTDELTPREREIANMIAEGLTNREIARRLVISPRTAEGHVERLLVKLGFTRRAQVAAWVHRR